MNFLALNLAYDVATGRRGVDEARRAYTEKALTWMAKGGDDEGYTERLQFEVPEGGTADPDEITLDDTMMHGIKEKVGGADE